MSPEELGQAEAQWHWGEGSKYVLEGARALILINGAAALAILTFPGSHSQYHHLIEAILFFASGAFAGALLLMFAYCAQLNYGNNANGTPEAAAWAQIWHAWSCIAAVSSAAFFFLGMLTAALGL
jgi:hypothetical protein